MRGGVVKDTFKFNLGITPGTPDTVNTTGKTIHLFGKYLTHHVHSSSRGQATDKGSDPWQVAGHWQSRHQLAGDGFFLDVKKAGKLEATGAAQYIHLRHFYLAILKQHLTGYGIKGHARLKKVAQIQTQAAHKLSEIDNTDHSQGALGGSRGLQEPSFINRNSDRTRCLRQLKIRWPPWPGQIQCQGTAVGFNNLVVVVVRQHLTEIYKPQWASHTRGSRMFATDPVQLQFLFSAQDGEVTPNQRWDTQEMLSPTDAGVVKYRKLMVMKHFVGRDAALADERAVEASEEGAAAVPQQAQKKRG